MISKILNKFLILIIKIYKYFISPYFPLNCRYLPTCSEYTKESIIKYGVVKGFWLGLKRIVKCHPWGKGGYDPIK